MVIKLARFIRRRFGPGEALKGALYIIWCGVNRLGDSGVKVVRIDSAIFQLLLSRRVSYC